MNSFVIIPCKVQDVERLREIQKEVWLATYPNEANGITREAILVYFEDKEKTSNWIHNVKQALANDKNTHGWLAKIDNAIVGYSFAKKMEEKNNIMSLYVLPTYQKQGIGRKLMEKMLAWFTNTNPVVLEVASYNTNAITFYTSFGFVHNGPTQNCAEALSTGIVIPEIAMIKQQ